MRRIIIASAVFFLVGIAPALAQNYPTQQPITVVVPYPPGGTTDNMMRIIQEKAQALLGQAIVVLNKPGATGNIGGAYVANAKPDGYTLLLQATMIGYFPTIFSNMMYDPMKAYEPIISVGESPSIFVVRADSPLKTLADFDAAQKANPKGVSIGNTGTGAPAHLAAVLLAKLNNFTFTHIPYKGTSPLMTDLLGGQIDVAVTSPGGFMGMLQSGAVRILAVASAERSQVIPDAPTTKDAGYAEMKGGVRYFLGAPAGTPKPIIEKLYQTFITILKDPAIVAQLNKAGFDVVTATPEGTLAMLQEQHDLWSPILTELGIKLQ